MKIESIKPAFQPLTITIETADEARAIADAIGDVTGIQRAKACGFSWDADVPRARAVHSAMSALYDACKDAAQ